MLNYQSVHFVAFYSWTAGLTDVIHKVGLVWEKSTELDYIQELLNKNMTGTGFMVIKSAICSYFI